MRELWRHKFRRGTLWLFLLIGILGGLGLSLTSRDPGWLLPILAISVILTLRKRSSLTLCLVFILGISWGWSRGSAYTKQLNIYKPIYYHKVTIREVANEDAIYDQHKQLAFSAANIRINDRRYKGKLQISGFGANAVLQGDEVEATGKLYPGYGTYQGRLSFAKLEVVSRHPTLVSEIRRRFVAGMQTALPEPLAPFAMGLLVGQRATLPDKVKQDLLMVGLTHIIAVSGYNLTIILQASRQVLGKRSKRVSTFLSVGLIGVFLLVAGSSASIVRAAIVSMLSIFTTYYGRAIKSLNLICLVAVITAWANPAYLWGDLSWYLSFLAFFGVMVLSPLIQARWPAKWHQSLIGSVALESICAEIMSLPFILHVFGQMSRVGLIANVLVVSLIPLAMLLSLIAGLAGMLIGSVAGWFAWPAAILLNYMLDVAHILANLPHVFAQGIGLSLWQMLALYACVVGLAFSLWYKSVKSAIITDMIELKTKSLLV
jgi:competence protein ComEC